MSSQTQEIVQIKQNKPIIVLDANAFITGAGLLDLGATHRLVTSPQVMDQLRDSKTRQLVQKFVFDIQQISPQKKYVQLIRDFARKTGDIASLSDVDMQLLAVTYSLYVRQGLSQNLNKAPLPMKQLADLSDNQQHEQQSQQEQQYSSQEQQQEKQKQQQKTQQVKQNNQDDDQWNFVPVAKKPKRKQTQSDMDDDQGWITPVNYEKKMAEGTIKFEASDQQQEIINHPISIMTADFAMQNVALQMGMNIKSLDGRKIKQVRRFIMQCYLCYKQYKIQDNKIVLCKQCGYNSLSKISYSISQNGIILHRKRGWKPNQKVLQWKQRKYQQQQKKKKHQHARRKKGPSIFEA